MELSKNEVKVLKLLKELGSAKDIEIAEKTGLNLDGVRRSIYFLQEKGLVNMSSKSHEELVLTEEGKRAKDMLPEEELSNYNGEPISQIPDELRKYVGKLKQEGLATIEGGKFILKGEINNYSLKKALASGDYSIAKKELLKRGYVEEIRNIEIEAEITQQGREYPIEDLENKEAVVELTREMLESGSWKSMKLKPLNLRLDAVEEAQGGIEHPLVRAKEKLRKIFLSMGFQEMSGNYVETSFWNFDALYQPQDHPSRELADTFYLNKDSTEKIPEELLERVREAHEKGWKYKWKLEEALKLVLRTHTTVLSARTLYKKKRGKFFSIGRVFRNEAVDYKHLAEFHQVEGIIAHENVNFRNLLYILKEFYRRIGFDKVRFRPSYFPYTEPSLEIEVWFEPKQEWVELGGAGIFRKEVVRPLGAEYPVLAWGLSLERPLMMLMGREDIRDFYTNKMDFLREYGGL